MLGQHLAHVDKTRAKETILRIFGLYGESSYSGAGDARESGPNHNYIMKFFNIE